jgi:uncharacterized membrane protein YGL010W
MAEHGVRGGDWLAHLLIVPGAHVRVGDFDFQAATYEEFHVDWRTRVLHMACTPIVLVGALVALGAVPIDIALGSWGEVPACTVVLATGLAAYFVGLDAIVGVVAIPIVAGLLAASIAIGRALGDHALVVGALASIGAAIVQAGSHLFEPVPPPWSGSTPRPLRAVLREATPRLLLGLLALTLVSFALEWWASFRVLGLQINFVLMRAGLRPALRARLERG